MATLTLSRCKPVRPSRSWSQSPLKRIDVIPTV